MAVRDRILKDENSDISDHLRNHIHLTNCIHLKNHMHKNSPILADRLLMKDLMLLQRSRSLRDPSSSPRSWTPPSVIGMLSKQVEMDPTPREGRKSFGVERPRNGRRLSGSSLQVTSRVAPVEVASFINGVEAVCDLSSSKSGVRDGRRIKKEVSSRKSLRTDPFGVGSSQHKECNELGGDCVSAKSERKDKMIKQRTMQSQDVQVKTLSDQLNEIPMDSDGATSYRFTFGERGRHYQQDKSLDKAGKIVHGYCGGSNRVKRHKFRSARRKAAIALREIGAQKDMSVASNSLAYVSGDPIYHIERGREECVDQSATRDPRNGCGIPWNWSRIHHRSKTFLDMAGRSLSCGLSESRLRKGGQGLEGRDITDLPVALDQSSSPTKSDAEVLPLLIEESGSRGSNENAVCVHDYSGELGIFANHLLKHDVDSDLASEARVGDRHKSKVYRHSRHQNLTQKWMPRTFRDLVGQNLVTQALSNAVLKRKVGLLYAFYGPHGTGKTSCARIFARALNCQSLEHSKPCGFCNSCLSHDKGKSRNIKEVGPVSNFDFDSIMDLLEDMIVLQLPSQYRVFIFDDCDTMSSDSWGAISNVIDRAPRRLVFILVSSSLDVLPHIILSRCQKFFFPKLKDADIICTLQWIATKEKFEVDKDALKLIASRSDGSLRDAEMTLEQLSLLGQRISVPLVQELVGLISDEKLVDLLDLALSADTVNTVKNLRETIETGVEPLALMSQLATIITDILAGSYDFTKERCSRKFFQHQSLSKRDMEKLRQALRTLSEAEKQLRMSNDKLTWLTAALLQLAPDQQYMLPGSSADASFNHSPVVHNSVERSAVEHANMPNHGNFQPESSVDVRENERLKGRISLSADRSVVRGKRVPDLKEIEEVWMEVLEKIQSDSIRDLMYQEGELISISFGPAPTVQLTFHSQMTKSKVEKFRRHVLQAFESVLGPLVTIHIRCDSRKGLRAGIHRPLPLPTYGNDLSRTAANPEVKVTSGGVVGREEIEEISASPPREPNSSMHDNNAGVGEEPSSVKRSSMAPLPWKQSQSLVRSRVSLAHVIQQAEGHAQRNGWSKSKAVSIAEKLEQENLRLEPRSRSLLCWKASRVSRPRLSRLKIRVRRPQSLLKFVSCGKCLSTRSSR